MNQETSLDKRAISEARQKEAFAKHMEKAQTKLGLSLIPAGDHPEALQVLLQEAFDAGANFGTAEVVGVLVESMLGSKPSRPKY